MKRKILSLTVILCLAGQAISCSSDDNTKETITSEVFETQVIEDINLVKALKELGYEFDGNALKLTDKVLNAKTLDLSAKQISNLNGIKAFNQLEEIILKDNNFILEFDFSSLPKSVKSIDLQNNELYEFYNISKQHSLTKLYLPEQARFNMEDVLEFYNANKEDILKNNIDMKMVENGKLSIYTTLREIPDPILREYMQETFPSMFSKSGEKIDIATPMRVPENTAEFHLGLYFNYSSFSDPNYDQTKDPDTYDNTYLYLDDPKEDFKTTRIKNYEGIQYILQHKDYGASWFDVSNNAKEVNSSIEYLKIPDNGLTWFWMRKFNIKHGINITSKSLKMVVLNFMSGFETLDLSSCSDFFVGGALTMSGLEISNSHELKNIVIPKSKLSDPEAGQIRLRYLSKLQEADFSHLTGLWGTSSFKGLPSWNAQFPEKLSTIKGSTRIAFDKLMLDNNKEKAISIMHKLADAAEKHQFFLAGINPLYGTWSNTLMMDKDGKLLEKK
ncbi:hypothetical protein [Myroides odoratimimus]|uniref:hypothetical protein n=1 Tax=Myroides odoratimimus TaxID=76832 RepID=UPI001CE0A557|nr:hypothetical protein [Myroides odoratimimus]MCA4807018.1 hypothetical protein [Myroides odoratimimus]